MTRQESLIAAEDLSVGYREPLIEHIDFAVHDGEILTLIGPNGSGKSTILKTLAGHLKQHHGTVYIENSSADALTPNERARKRSVLLTERPRQSFMTCREMVEMGRYPYTGHFGLLSPIDQAAVQAAIQLVQMEDFAGQSITAISDGQRQRVLLARAICQEPEILILDEPTSYLDIHHKILFLEILRKLAAEKHMAIIVSMHELDFAEKIADYVLCVKDGDIFRHGKPEDIFRGDLLRQLFDILPDLYAKYLT